MPPGIPIGVRPYQPEPRSRTIIWQMEVSDVIEPLYLPSATYQSAAGSRRYVAVFYCGDFWASNLTYLEFKGNEVCLTRLGDIITKNKRLESPHTRRDVYLLNYNAPLPESVVSALLSVSGEGLRSLLIAHLEAPFPDGWKDRNQWVVRNTSQMKLDGQLALLPSHPPDDYQFLSCLETGWEDYPSRLVALFLRSYVRPWLPTSFNSYYDRKNTAE